MGVGMSTYGVIFHADKYHLQNQRNLRATFFTPTHFIHAALNIKN